MNLSTPVQYVKGVGPHIARLLERLGISTVRDLLWHLPFRYIDRRAILSIKAVAPGKERVVIGTVVSSGITVLGRRRTRIFELLLDDGTGTMSAKWFRFYPKVMQQRFPKGSQILCAGELTQFGGVKQFIHPEVERLDEEGETEVGGKVLPIYPLTEGLSQRQCRRYIREAWSQIQPTQVDLLPEALRKKFDLISVPQALAALHFPSSDVDITQLNNRQTAATRTLVFDECFFLELGLGVRRATTQAEVGIAMEPREEMTATFRRALPFSLTAAQERVGAAIRSDMRLPRPMHRLVQGDVGSGKTVVAIGAALHAIAAGYQAAFMAPTEILAEQHARTVRPWLDTLQIPWALLTASVKGNERRTIYERTAAGDLPLLIGTHALVEEAVQFAQLGLVIIDEQHRFGVMQRLALIHKGSYNQPHTGGEGVVAREDLASPVRAAQDVGGPGAAPPMEGARAPEINEQHRFGVMQRLALIHKGSGHPHLLVMSATPIPRTLAMTVYGDLDISIIDELPVGRRQIITKLYDDRQRAKLYAGMRRELAKGRQIYVVYPLVAESEKVDLKNATDMAKALHEHFGPTYQVALLHGKMRGQEKDAIMQRFITGQVQILATTSVVEVGVDVPNATVMIVEHAERFGLSQLHQLRGRVGRGSHQSYCILVANIDQSDTARARLQIMTETTDGFRIAEEDLQIRGPGEFLGTRQSGLPELKVANLLTDQRVIEMARQAAFELIEGDPLLTAPESGPLRKTMLERWGARLALGKVG